MTTEAQATVTPPTSSEAQARTAGTGKRRRAPREGGAGRRQTRRPIDDAPPRFDVVELAQVAGPALWQACHDATVLDLNDDGAVVRLAGEGEPFLAVVPRDEASRIGLTSGTAVRVRLGDPPKNNAPPRASVLEAERLDALDAARTALEGEVELAGTIAAEVKGGFVVALHAGRTLADGSQSATLRAFLPRSAALHPRLHPDGDPTGEDDTFKVMECDADRGNVVVSRKHHLNARARAREDDAWTHLAEGTVVPGVVRSVVAYGAFVDVGGVDGLLHASDLSWDRSPRPASMLRVGQTLDLMVLVADRSQRKLKLGLKQLAPDPWANASSTLRAGDEVDGTVVALADFGAFVRVGDATAGVEGLVHVSEISWDRIRHASNRLSIGDAVRARVLEVDPKSHRLSLSIKALEKNPFARIAERFPPGAVLRAKVRSLVDFGVFIELDESVDGLVHIGELSWTEHVTHPSQLLTIGQEVEVVVLGVDIERQRVSCSIKQTQENPWRAWERKFPKGSRHTFTCSRVIDQGAFFDVEPELSGFCGSRDLVGEGGGRPADVIKPGQSLELEVRALDKKARRLLLSARAVQEGDTRAAYDEYKRREQQAGTGRLTLGDALGGKLKKALDSQGKS